MKLHANYFQIICKTGKNGKVLWSYESETLHPELRISLLPLVTRIIQAMELLQHGINIVFNNPVYKEEAKHAIKRRSIYGS